MAGRDQRVQQHKIRRLSKFLREFRRRSIAPEAIVEFGIQDNKVRAKTSFGSEELPVSVQDWKEWASTWTAAWWSHSSGITALVDGKKIQFDLGAESAYLKFSRDGLNVFVKDGGPALAVTIVRGNPIKTDLISSGPGGSVKLVFDSRFRERDAVVQLQALEERRTSEFDTLEEEDSNSLHSNFLMEELVRGSREADLLLFTDFLRSNLPRFKIGVPQISDVVEKLKMELNLRRSEDETGSIRPLAFTLEAIQMLTEAPKISGLWLISSQEAKDVRTYIHQLLLWDTVLYFVAAALKVHGEFKSGFVFSDVSSFSTIRKELRYTHRGPSEVESVYIQVNPYFLVGSPEAVTFRLLQLASHELAHLSTFTNVAHPDYFVVKRESYQFLIADYFPMLRDLVSQLGFEEEWRASVERAITPEKFVIEEVARRPLGSSTGMMIRRWAILRNMSRNKAEKDISAELIRQEKLGRLFVDDEVIRAMS